MVKKNFIKYIIAVLLFFFVGSICGQSASEKRNREHAAVKDLLTKMSQQGQSSPAVENEKFSKPYDGNNTLQKINSAADRKSYYMNGNKIGTQIFNYGGIAPGYGLLRGVNNFVWKDLSYVFQFCPIVGAEVRDTSGKKIHIISDGLNDYTSPMLQELNPTGDTAWQWQPLPGFAEADQPNMASNPAVDADGDGKPDSWPRGWYNPTLGKYVWPGFLSQNAANSDLEVYWKMDDRDNTEFKYFPFEEDKTRKGLGLEVDGRAFQWSNALAENTIFFIYSITNVSGKDLDSVFFGIYGDPDIGGGTPENKDDNGYFIPPYSLDSVDVSNIPVYARSMVYFYDPDMKGDLGLPLGYLGCKFLESPGNSDNNFDDDGDGMVDESQEDGIDNDGDWNPDLHDLGLDGIAATFDEGEGDGIPTAGFQLSDGSLDPLYPGEPNFEFTDLDESDQIGLTSFNSWTWNQDKISDDESMWNRSIPGNFGAIQQNTDLVFIFGSGYISLKAGETKRISMALLLGQNLEDLLLSAETVQTIYNQNYQFFKPPNTPTVKAVADDKKVTLYWDSAAEESDDPITGKDFEGYVIYRSVDPSFNDIQTITDGKGSFFLNEPLKTKEGLSAKWDLDNAWEGYHPIPYQGRGVHYDLGNNSGLVHSFVDTNNVINGQTYYYAIVAYDHGDSIGIPPTETTKKITVDPITSILTFDKNTVMVVPGPRTSGYVKPSINTDNVVHIEGVGTGDVQFNIMDDLAIEKAGNYSLEFADSMNSENGKIKMKNYSIIDLSLISETAILYDTNFAQLSNKHIANDGTFDLHKQGGDILYVEGTDYIVNYEKGIVRRTGVSTIPNESTVTISYHYYPIYESTDLAGGDSNPIFNGVQVIVADDPELKWDQENSRWLDGSKTNLKFSVGKSLIGVNKEFYPGKYEITFSSTNIDSAVTYTTSLITIPVNYSVKEISTGVPIPIITFLSEVPSTKNVQWDPGEQIVFFKPYSAGTIQDTLTWGVVITDNLDDSTAIPVIPTDGDILFIETYRPFKNNDKFAIETIGADVSKVKASANMDNIYVVPNPYVGYNEIEPTNKLPGQTRGERRIYFENLPSQCTIRIYSLSGDPVKVLEHDVFQENAREYWNLLNEDGFSVSYGVYIAHIDAPGVGEKIIKFAIIK
ncbi:MAG: hypothetical protein KKF62_10945 [Bacteroidetes bacterium]|nr:hypothetical protein [Bacteroidota bacterium]MBU1114808.1 hypothetical protein [Bacteroidota bacterium]MBU1797000.1 hypothetical protein [Bacteroidota bacterium]